MVDTNASSHPHPRLDDPSPRQDNAIPSGEYDDNQHNVRADENCSDHENERLSTPPTNRFFASFFVARNAKVTSIDSGPQASPSETTPLLVPVDHKSCESGDFLSVLWNEIKTLVRYALPVFGFVYSASLLLLDVRFR